MYAARHAQIPKTISLQYLKGEVNGEVEFLHAGKHENLLQIDITVLMDMVKHFQSSQNSKFTISVQYLKKEDSDDVDFLHADKYRSGLQVDFNTLGIKAAYKAILLLLIGMMKHSQITQSNNFANLCSISKKLRAEFIFCIQINTKVSKNWHYRFWWKEQIRSLVIFLQYIKKKVFYFLTTFVFYCDVKHLDISSHVCCLLSFLLHLASKIWYIYIYIYIADITFP